MTESSGDFSKVQFSGIGKLPWYTGIIKRGDLLIPAFDPATGALPAGIHESDWAEVVSRFGTNPHRRALLAGMRRAFLSLAEAGCARVYLGGSFVTAKAEPGDWDGCYEAAGVDFFRLEKVIVRRNKFMMGAFFSGEIYDADAQTITGEPFRLFFQRNRADNLVGMIALDPRSIG